MTWTARYPAIVQAALRLPATHFVMDGEGVVEGEGGIGDFKLLHFRKHDRRCQLIAFDLLLLGALDLKAMPLVMRKDLLAELLEGSTGGVVYADHMEGGDGAAMYEFACRMGLEGMSPSVATSPTRPAPATTGSRSRIRMRRGRLGWLSELIVLYRLLDLAGIAPVTLNPGRSSSCGNCATCAMALPQRGQASGAASDVMSVAAVAVFRTSAPASGRMANVETFDQGLPLPQLEFVIVGEFQRALDRFLRRRGLEIMRADEIPIAPHEECERPASSLSLDTSSEEGTPPPVKTGSRSRRREPTYHAAQPRGWPAGSMLC